MIDFHSHILPGIDDGSKSTEESMKMLEMESQQGVKHIVATPHFYATRHSVERFLLRREESLNRILSIQDNVHIIPEIHVGAEVYYFPNIGRAKVASQLCIDNTSALLLELPFCQWTEQHYRDVKELIEKQHLTVVLAHVERYYEFQRNPGIWEKMLQLPVFIQLNAGSFMVWKKRRLGLKLLKERYPIILGSDCHNLTNRMPNIQATCDLIARKLGEKTLEDMNHLGKRILR